MSSAEKYAIFSDVHGNTKALGLVLHDMQERGVTKLLCLGDIGELDCVRLLRSQQVQTVFGNSDLSAWRHMPEPERSWLLNLPPQIQFQQAGFWVSHANPAWPSDIGNLQAFLATRSRFGMHQAFPYYLSPDAALFNAFSTLLEAEMQVLFHGHTHQQKSWIFSADNQVHQHGPISLQLESEKTYIIGVGSVGRPKDASGPTYVLFEPARRHVSFVRL